MRLRLLFVLLFTHWAFIPLFCQTHGPEQQKIYEVADSVLFFPGVIGNTEILYGKPHLLVPQFAENKTIEAIPFEDNSDDWKVFFLLAGISSLALARFFFSSRIGLFIKAATGNVSFNQMEREGGFFNETLTYLLFFNFLLVFSLLIWQTIAYFQLTPAHQFLGPFLLFVTLIILITLFFLFKSLLLGFVAWVFKTSLPTAAYMKNIFLFNQLIGLALIIPVAYLIYNPSITGLMFTWSLWLFLNLLKVVRGVIIGYNVSAFPGYYLILYLCTIEFAPLMLIIKLGSNYFLTA
jgi:hypothetical protein